MDKTELISATARKANITVDQAEMVTNTVISEIFSPAVIGSPADRIKSALLGDNHCENNCPPPSLLDKIMSKL